MVSVPNMLLIGAANRDAGKTTFACELIRRFSTIAIQAAKVTVIQERDGQCPRGGEGCGVCTSLEGTYCLTEETVVDGNKDTQRMLQAGARRVFWLRVLRAELESGVGALLEAIGPDTPFVCESNSLRHAVAPGVFLMVQNKNSSFMKASARSVLQYADEVVYSDGRRFEFMWERIGIERNQWVVR